MAPSRESRPTPTGHARRDGLPRRFRSSTLRDCGAGRACPRTDTLSEAFTALGEPPERGHADIVAAAETISQFRCTNLTPSCAQETLAVNNMYELPIPDEYVDNVPDDDDLPALSYGVHRLRRIQIPGDIPGLPPARSSDRGERARSGGHRTRVDPYGPQRLKELRGHGLARRTPQGWRRGRRSLNRTYVGSWGL